MYVMKCTVISHVSNIKIKINIIIIASEKYQSFNISSMSLDKKK